MKCCTVSVIFLFLSTAKATNGILDPCQDSAILYDDLSRSSACKEFFASKCDRYLESGWYKILLNKTQEYLLMPTSCMSMYTCGAKYPVWMNGSYPEESEGVVQRTGCMTTPSSCCEQKYPIKVKNCGQFMAFHLTRLYGCSERYCFGSKPGCQLPEPEITTTKITTPLIVTETKTNIPIFKENGDENSPSPTKNEDKTGPSPSKNEDMVIIVVIILALCLLITVIGIMCFIWIKWKSNRKNIKDRYLKERRPSSDTISRCNNGYDQPMNMTPMPIYNTILPVSVSRSEKGYITPVSNFCYNEPASDKGYITPTSNSGYITPSAERGHITPATNRGYITPLKVAVEPVHNTPESDSDMCSLSSEKFMIPVVNGTDEK